MAEDGIIDVDELGSEDLEPDIQYLGLGVLPGPLSHREKIMIIPATKQASSRIIYDVDGDVGEKHSNIATGSAHQSATPRHPEPLIAGPSKQTLVQRDMHSVRLAPSVELLSDDDDIIELPQAPKRARRGHSTSTSQKRLKAEKPKRQPVSIVISDSDADIDTMIEMMEGSSVPLTRPQTGDGQVHEQHTTDSDSDYDTFHAGLDINDPSNWTQLELSKDFESLQDDHDTQLDIALAAQAVAREIPNIIKRRIKMDRRIRQTTYNRPYRPPAQLVSRDSDFVPIWELAQKAAANTPIGFCLEKNDSPLRAKFRHGPLSRYINLRTVEYKHFSPGPVNSIAQSKGMISIASCVLWDINSTEDASRIYNQDASLKLMYGGHVVKFQGHSSAMPAGLRYHTVNDTHFDPTKEYHLVSCGTDGQVIISDCSGVVNGESPKIMRSFKLEDGRIPLGILFKPDSSIFAVWDTHGYIGIQRNDRDHSSVEYRACRAQDQPVQSVAWGQESSSSMVFASTASDVWDSYSGFHKAFDVEHGTRLRSFENENAGECLDINPQGNELALVTCGDEQRFELSMYDIRSRESTHNIQLDRLPRWYEETPETRADPSINKLPSTINQVSYSSDGVHIALARSDNTVHVYDSRFLNRRLFNFRHNWGTEGTLDDLKYGVYKIEWMNCPNTGKLSLISGGADGCVRLWDLSAGRSRLWHTENGAILAQSESYAGWFSLGDPAKGEKPLILGDGGGSIVMKDTYERT